jgi:hypothetical protein
MRIDEWSRASALAQRGSLPRATLRLDRVGAVIVGGPERGRAK